MKKFFLASLALATALAITPAASASTFDYTFTSGSAVATGTLTGNLVAPGEYAITSGTIDLTGSAINGTGVFSAILPNGNFYTGGGAILTFSSPWDSDLYPGQDPQIDNNGAFTFDITSGPGAGNGLAIWSNGPDNYGGFGGNWTFDDRNGGGSFNATNAATPEPSSLLLLGTGLLGLAFVAFRKAKPSRPVLHLSL